MANMSYCRFENTLRDLKDCDDHLHAKNLSETEEKARKELIAVCKRITEDSEED